MRRYEVERDADQKVLTVWAYQDQAEQSAFHHTFETGEPVSIFMVYKGQRGLIHQVSAKAGFTPAKRRSFTVQ